MTPGSYASGMEGRPTFAALVALIALQVVLVYAVGGARYEFVQLLGLAVLVVALRRLAAGSFVAWSLLFVLNVMPLADAVMTAFARGTSMASPLVVLLATSVPILAVLLSPPMRRRIRDTTPEPHPPAVPTA